MDVVFEDKIDDNDEKGDEETNNLVCDSEDVVPLARFVMNLLVVWTNDVNYVARTNPFVEATGANFSDNAETPTDVFLELFPEDLIWDTFQTNLSLLSDGIYASGTFPKREKYFSKLKGDKNMEREDADYRISTDGLVAMKWMDRRSVLFLGNYQSPALRNVLSRRKNMELLQSAFILFQLRSQSRRLNLKTFRLSVARGLIGAVEPFKLGRPSSEKSVNKFKKLIPLGVRQSKACHMPERSTWLRCANCSTTKEVSHTICKCSICNVELCIKHDKNCFTSYYFK
ncbi:hypothetical protein NQ314_006055 [Rhamnusium bicolor]|uniref:PiggyBac transposable element-derived protein domain-containing protein n=1 Tax=Rhamnusium bicolor TaxID=1586634 RepID=A0AAV8ZAS0_9CUCU|nr:hypothetical protein NQ314_006055 [Rhamnusium bicolor]